MMTQQLVFIQDYFDYARVVFVLCDNKAERGPVCLLGPLALLFLVFNEKEINQSCNELMH